MRNLYIFIPCLQFAKMAFIFLKNQFFIALIIGFLHISDPLVPGYVTSVKPM